MPHLQERDDLLLRHKYMDYVPMPGDVVKAVRKLWASEIKDASGKPVFVLSN